MKLLHIENMSRYDSYRIDALNGAARESFRCVLHNTFRILNLEATLWLTGTAN